MTRDLANDISCMCGNAGVKPDSVCRVVLVSSGTAVPESSLRPGYTHAACSTACCISQQCCPYLARPAAAVSNQSLGGAAGGKLQTQAAQRPAHSNPNSEELTTVGDAVSLPQGCLRRKFPVSSSSSSSAAVA
jgi:hypothetical protein